MAMMVTPLPPVKSVKMALDTTHTMARPPGCVGMALSAVNVRTTWDPLCTFVLSKAKLTLAVPPWN